MKIFTRIKGFFELDFDSVIAVMCAKDFDLAFY
jgi:hypothetical protein